MSQSTDPEFCHGRVQEALERQDEVRQLKELYKLEPVPQETQSEHSTVVVGDASTGQGADEDD